MHTGSVLHAAHLFSGSILSCCLRRVGGAVAARRVGAYLSGLVEVIELCVELIANRVVLMTRAMLEGCAQSTFDCHHHLGAILCIDLVWHQCASSVLSAGNAHCPSASCAVFGCDVCREGIHIAGSCRLP
jgi:hypothetical protein